MHQAAATRKRKNLQQQRRIPVKVFSWLLLRSAVCVRVYAVERTHTQAGGKKKSVRWNCSLALSRRRDELGRDECVGKVDVREKSVILFEGWVGGSGLCCSFHLGKEDPK